jgi:pyruvate,orthophosphate dikinase
MVFGNAGGDSGSGVGFTRDPSTGERELYLDFRFNAQGEDVVSGRYRTGHHERLKHCLPAVWKEIETTAQTLEALFRDAQDFEFTVQNGILYLLQARNAKRSDWAAIKIATDLVGEGLIDQAEAQRRLSAIDLNTVSRTRLEAHHDKVLARAEPASAGVAIGAIALDSSAVERMTNEGTPILLVRRETATSDIEGMASAVGILTATGSRTSHAAVVARQLGRVCLVGCAALEIDLRSRRCKIGGLTVFEGDYLTLDGNHGCVYPGKLHIVTERPERELRQIAAWEHTVVRA